MAHIQKKENKNTTNLKSRLNLLLSATIVCALLSPMSAHAEDGCATLKSNPEWNNGMKQLLNAIQTNDMTNAKIQSKILADICPNAPTLNYLQGKIAESLGEKQDALYYYQKASENTYAFAVDPDNAKKIWYARYENEHPERSASAVNSNSESFAALEAQNVHLQELNAQHLESYKKLLWAGVGIGAGGLALAGTGAALVALSHSSKIEKEAEAKPNKVSDDPMHATGWIATGLGAGLLITGAVLAGVYGYKYKQSDNQDISFNLSPSYISFDIRF